MAGTRKDFLAAASSVGLGISLASPAQAQTSSPLASPSAKPAAAASPFARDFAQHMRSFDPHLTDAQVDSIAHQIDDLYRVRGALRPKGRGLSNGDAPSPQFEVNE